MSLSCSQLSVAYDRHTALKDFDLFCSKGEVRALIGPNGSGKSTALRAIAGLINLVDGQVQIEEKSIRSMSRRLLAKHFAFLPQHPTAPDEMTVAQLVRQGRFAHVGLFRRYSLRDEAAIRWALEITNLTGFVDRRLNQLSGGERQRAWIAAVIAQQAQILLLDEPTSFLDISYQVEVLNIIHRLSEEKGITVVMAIHDLNQAIAVCDRISLLDRGLLAFDGHPQALVSTDLIKKVFRVQGTFVPIREGAPPHFDVELVHKPSPRSQ